MKPTQTPATFQTLNDNSFLYAFIIDQTYFPYSNYLTDLSLRWEYFLTAQILLLQPFLHIKLNLWYLCKESYLLRSFSHLVITTEPFTYPSDNIQPAHDPATKTHFTIVSQWSFPIALHRIIPFTYYLALTGITVITTFILWAWQNTSCVQQI